MARRVALFLDANYVRKGAARLLGTKDCDLNWGVLSERLFDGRPRLRAYYYDAVLTRQNAPDTSKLADPEAQKRREEFDAIVSSRHRFIQSISHIPYFRVRLAKCRGRYPDTEQKGVDTRITLDMLDLSRKGAFDTAILASGDSDLVEVVESVTGDGRHVELVYYRGSAGNDLLQVCDCCRVLDAEFVKGCLK